jgi:hypothetical protein
MSIIAFSRIVPFKRLAFGFGAFEHGIGAADRVGESLIRKIVESIIRLGSLSHDLPPGLG